MTQIEQILDGLPAAITIRFFATFARFEFALMRCNYLRAGRGNLAEADWTRLPDDLGDDFFACALASEKVLTLINDPPKKLIVQDGAPVFGPRPKVVDNAPELFKAARQVRHNLFHGNKMIAVNRERDVELMTEVLWLIEFIMERLPPIRSAFYEPRYA
jgi:hypothetical protein